jgi:hypothetical protein
VEEGERRIVMSGWKRKERGWKRSALREGLERGGIRTGI